MTGGVIIFGELLFTATPEYTKHIHPIIYRRKQQKKVNHRKRKQKVKFKILKIEEGWRCPACLQGNVLKYPEH